MRFLTTYSLEKDKVEAFTEEENWEEAQEEAEEYVWQYADNKKQAISQHFDKLDLWEKNPNLKTY